MHTAHTHTHYTIHTHTHAHTHTHTHTHTHNTHTHRECFPKSLEKKHQLIAHRLLKCECGMELPQLALHHHQLSQCIKRSVKCQFKWCQLVSKCVKNCQHCIIALHYFSHFHWTSCKTTRVLVEGSSCTALCAQ